MDPGEHGQWKHDINEKIEQFLGDINFDEMWLHLNPVKKFNQRQRNQQAQKQQRYNAVKNWVDINEIGNGLSQIRNHLKQMLKIACGIGQIKNR